MNIAELLGQIIQKPQSVTQGGVIGVLKMLGMDSPEVDPTANPETQRIQQLIGGISNPLDGIKAGWENSIRPSDAFRMNGYGDNMADKIGMNVADVAADPMLALGGLSKGAAAAGKLGKASKYVDAATTVGKLGPGATRGQKIAQGARQAYQGTLAMGDPLAGLGAGMVMRGVENRLLPAIAGRMATRTAASSVDDVIDAVNPDKAMADALGMAQDAISRPMPNKVGHQLLNADDAMGSIRPTLMNPVPETIEGVGRINPELLQGSRRASILEERMKALGAGPDPSATIPMGPATSAARPTAFLPENVTAPRQQLTGMMDEAMAPRPQLPRGQLTGPSTAPNYGEQLSAILGKKGDAALQSGERGDELLRQILSSGRAGTGRFTTAEQRKLLEFLQNDPEGLNYVISQLRYK